MLGSDGDLYGTTREGGAFDFGMIFQLTPDSVYTNLHSFSDVDPDGAYPEALLTEGADGVFYGTTTMGGHNGFGTVFQITPDGTLTTLHSFSDAEGDGANPVAGLVRGADGNFYGTTNAGGGNGGDGSGIRADDVSGVGTVFQVTPQGGFTTLYSFTGTGTDGANPQGSLVARADGNFYGTTSLGGSSNQGTLFKLNVVPAITSAGSATAQVGMAFSYQITASNNAGFFGVQGLPKSLTLNDQTGVISGTPTAAGKATITLKASNVFRHRHSPAGVDGQTRRAGHHQCHGGYGDGGQDVFPIRSRRPITRRLTPPSAFNRV